ncbi:hypothetical protein Slin15195_G126200 [Septoria linicola]|uniref:Uncharacterized protein n=1 Tax=Septoria linicola TaxID=215465 RepID=A0A9Q9B923_9PEZI|nr:hypothetical protein Slin14017_G082380 [Septoria linicola]USW59301.1 hypothetical protein Slin15195_G126200 [Septoria linicola]
MILARSALLSALVLFASNAAAAEASPELAAHVREVMARQVQSDGSTTASSSSEAATATATGDASVPTEVTGCHTHSDGYYCFEGDAEWELTTELENYDNAPDDYNECQAGENDDTIQCADGSGGQVTLIREGSEEEDHDHDHTSSTTSAAASASETPSATDAAAEASSSAPANAGNAVLPASGVSLFALLAYFL